jgi:hypothetical protein
VIPTDWAPCVNVSGGPIPSFGVAVVAGVDEDGNFGLDTPDADNDAGVIVLGAGAMPEDGFGQGTFDPRVWVLYDERDGTPEAGEEWGVKTGEYRLREGYTGFRCLGGASGGLANWVRVPPTAAADTAAGECGTACGTLVGLATGATLQLELVCATGSFAAIDTDQFAALYAFGSGGTWTFKEWVDGAPGSWTNKTLDWDGGTGTAVFTWNGTPLPTLTLGGTSITLRCLDADATFAAGPRNGINGDGGYTPAAACESNELVLRVSCSCTPLDGWEGADEDGTYYCIAAAGDDCAVDDTYCVLLYPGDECLTTIQICSGPYANEAACLAACSVAGGTVLVDCCANPLPEEIDVVFGGTLAGLGTQTLTYDAGLGYWQVTGLNCDGTAGAGTLRLTCNTSTWNLSGFAAFSFDATETDCDPLTIAFSGTVLFGTCSGAATATVS